MARNSLLFSITYYFISVVLLFSIFNVVFGQQVPQVPCPQYFHYEASGTGSEIIGVIQVNGPPIGKSLHLMIKLEIKSLPSNYVGSLGLSGTREEALNLINNNQPLKFIVKFPPGAPTPKLLQIYYNGQLICDGPSDPNAPIKIQLDHNLSTQFSNYSYQANTTFKHTYAAQLVPGHQPIVNTTSHMNTSVKFESRFGGEDQHIVHPTLIIPIPAHVHAPMHAYAPAPCATCNPYNMQQPSIPAQQHATMPVQQHETIPAQRPTAATPASVPAPAARPQENQNQQTASGIDYNYNPVQRNPLDDPPIVIDSQGIQL